MAEGQVGAGRGSRSLISKLKLGCVLHDASYLVPLEVSAAQTDLSDLLLAIRWVVQPHFVWAQLASRHCEILSYFSLHFASTLVVLQNLMVPSCWQEALRPCCGWWVQEYVLLLFVAATGWCMSLLHAAVTFRKALDPQASGNAKVNRKRTSFDAACWKDGSEPGPGHRAVQIAAPSSWWQSK